MMMMQSNTATSNIQPATAALEEAIRLSDAAPFSRKRGRNELSRDQTNDTRSYNAKNSSVGFVNMDDLLNSATFLETGLVFPTIDWKFNDDKSSKKDVQTIAALIPESFCLPEQSETESHQTRSGVSRKRRRRRSNKGMLRCATFDSSLASMHLNVSGSGSKPKRLHFICSSPSLEATVGSVEEASTNDSPYQTVWTTEEQEIFQ